MQVEGGELFFHQGIQLQAIRDPVEISIEARSVADGLGVCEPGKLIESRADQFHKVDDFSLQLVLAEAEGLGQSQRRLPVPPAVAGRKDQDVKH